MKKILLIDSSPRINGNSEVIVDTLANVLQHQDVTLFKMYEKNCNPCFACGACQGKETQSCVQDDDITALLPHIEDCDAIVMATPIYNHQMNSQAKMFIERFYPFFNIEKKNMSNTSKFGKKAAFISSCWGGPKDIYKKYADWTLETFSQIGVEKTKALVFDQIPGRGDIKINENYMSELYELAKWLEE